MKKPTISIHGDYEPALRFIVGNIPFRDTVTDFGHYLSSARKGPKCSDRHPIQCK